MLRSRSGSAVGRALIILFLVTAVGSVGKAGDGKAKRKKQQQAEEKSAEPGAEGINIPLPIGHEAKGLVIPDYDLQGHLNNRFDAGVAKRLDDVHVQLRDLKMITYTPDKKPDLRIDMSDSVLNMKTRVISSQKPTTVRRADFRITGDTMQFDTITRQGTMVGNVKMVIIGESHLVPKASE
jgi:Lipopolysaccharide-assembly, LptC-related